MSSNKTSWSDKSYLSRTVVEPFHLCLVSMPVQRLRSEFYILHSSFYISFAFFDQAVTPSANELIIPSANQHNLRASRPHHHLLLATQWWGRGIPMVEIQQVSSAEWLATGDLHTAGSGVGLA